MKLIEVLISLSSSEYVSRGRAVMMVENRITHNSSLRIHRVNLGIRGYEGRQDAKLQVPVPVSNRSNSSEAISWSKTMAGNHKVSKQVSTSVRTSAGRIGLRI